MDVLQPNHPGLHDLDFVAAPEITQEYFNNFFRDFSLRVRIPLIVRREFYREGDFTGLHRHDDFYALYVVHSGRGVHVINGQPYGVVRGDVYVAVPGSIHAYHDYRDLEVNAFYFQIGLFSDDELAALRSLPSFWRLFVAAPSRQDEKLADHRLHLPPERHGPVEEMVEEMRAEYASAEQAGIILARSLFFRMLMYLARWHAQRSMSEERPATEGARAASGDETSGPKRNVSYEVGLADVLRVCEQRFAEPLTVPQLAAIMFLSSSRFTEIFSREVGMPPAAYIRRLKLERARTLLRTTSLSATEIAHEVGFNDLAQLSRAFHSVYAVTPSAYRATFKKS